MHPLLLAELRTHRAVTADRAATWVSPAALRWAVRAGGITRLHHGVYCLTGTEDDLRTRLAGLDLVAGRPVVACLDTAAQLLGFSVDAEPLVHVIDPSGLLRSRHRTRVHQRRGAPVGRLGGQLITMPAWTAVELARTQPRPRALATLDAALRSGRCTRDELAAALHRQRGRRGTASLPLLVERADGRAESPMESETRLVVLDGGLPTPVLQHPVSDEQGRTRFRLDLAWPAARVAVEYDGFDHHRTPADLRRAHERRAWLAERGWTVLHASSDDVRRHPDVFLDRLRRALQEGRRPASQQP